MSSNNLLNVSQPIPIKYTKSYYSFSDPSGPNKKFLFFLTIYQKDNKELNFHKLEENKYSYMIDVDDNVDYNDIISFKVNVSEVPMSENNFEMKGVINHDTNTFTQKDGNFYIEFSKNQSNSTICTCYFIGVDFETMFVSPPN